MKKQQTGHVGGFTALNRGDITNCCSLVKIKASKKTTGGFVGENAGQISTSYYSGRASKLSGGVAGSGTGDVSQSYYFHSEPDGSKQLGALQDATLARHHDTVTKSEDAKELGFDMEERWQYIGGSQVMLFNSEKWFFDVASSKLYSRYLEKAPVGVGAGALGESKTANEPQVTSIYTSADLIEFAGKVNGGEREAMGAFIRLEGDIDLGGKAWAPIGSDPSKAFKGLFDGNGYTISNFVVKSADTNAKGLFGYLQGEVYNLNVDCVIKTTGGSTAGGIAAYCDGGVIGCCGVVAEIKGRGVNLGGLAGSNTGVIFQSYAAGAISSMAIPWWILPLPLLLALLFLIPGISPGDLPIFAPVPIDSSIRPTGDIIAPRDDMNFVTFEFEREINLNLATGEGIFNFINPGTSNHSVVIQLHFTDAQAIEVMGSTGRLDEDQQRLLASPQYNPENHRTVIAESGAIPPGYQLDNLLFTEHPNSATIPPGVYSATVYLIFYDIHTNNRAMMESQFPVIINVHSGV